MTKRFRTHITATIIQRLHNKLRKNGDLARHSVYKHTTKVKKFFKKSSFKKNTCSFFVCEILQMILY